MLIASILLAAQAAPAAPSLSPPLQPLAFLVGSCWRATFPAGRMTDTHCFTAVYGGHFLRDRHVVAGAPVPYLGETLYRWDNATRTIRWDYYSSDGMLMSGSAAGTDNVIGFETAVSPAEAASIAERIAWRHDGADAYVVTTQVLENGAWRPRPGAMRFQRIGPAPAD